MNRYLDVSVVRIQSYLTRAPSLKGRRGASTMISEATREVRAQLPVGVVGNEEAGAVDGVVSVRIVDSGVKAAAAATAICTQLRAALPAAELTATERTGPSYVLAYDDPETWSSSWPPAVPEWPVAKTCDWCRVWPATDDVHRVDGRDENHCRDCTRRLAAAGAATNPGRRPGPEKELLALRGGRELPDDFAELAELGRAGDDTHVATIYADGNAIGDYMKAQDHDPGLAAKIDQATWAAVLAMLDTIDDPSRPVPVIPHLVGGDDVLLSVPAHRVWPAVRALLTAFGAALPGTDAPTLSAGVVVHHRDFPLPDVIELGAELLKSSAKRELPKRAALAWHSITHDGVVRTGRAAVALSTLDEKWTALERLAAQPAAARQQMARLCRDRRAGDHESFTAHVERLGKQNIVDPFADGGIDLEDALSMVRWWNS